MTWRWACSVCGRSGDVEEPCRVYFHRCSEPYREDWRVTVYDLPADRETRRVALWASHRQKFEGGGGL